jgi:hypothetical protein
LQLQPLSCFLILYFSHLTPRPGLKAFFVSSVTLLCTDASKYAQLLYFTWTFPPY